ncbi:MAG: hypothetical protein M1812_005600 [Candelaria pacifica]|nr:MAG: hypothetical protein M1812_005600 [Candelaria pacifica]
MGSTIIDTIESLTSLLSTLVNLPTTPPALYLDVEGTNLSRHGKVSIIELLALPLKHVYLIDIHTLGEEAFSAANTDGWTLKAILEASNIPKVFFDVRSDSDALYGNFKIELAGVEDIQLLEIASRSFNRQRINGLARCIERDAQMTRSERSDWLVTKNEGRNLFDPKQGGSYEVFNIRPMKNSIRKYCIQDVLFLPQLWSTYTKKISPRWATLVRDETIARVALSRKAEDDEKGMQTTLSPWR